MIDFNEILDEYLKRPMRPREIGRYYPSEIGFCLRKIWYGYRNPVPISPEVLKIFEAGNVMHDFVATVFSSPRQKAVELLVEEMPFKMEKPEYTISGRVDDIVIAKVNGEELLIEVKSSAAIKWTKTPQTWHVSQLQLYMHATGVHKGAILYVEKNTLDSKIFEINYSKEEADKVIARFDTLHKHLIAQTIPEPEARQNKNMSWMCKKCDYRKQCYTDTPFEEEWTMVG